jgi:PAS domain S-box-containing protein
MRFLSFLGSETSRLLSIAIPSQPDSAGTELGFLVRFRSIPGVVRLRGRRLRRIISYKDNRLAIRILIPYEEVSAMENEEQPRNQVYLPGPVQKESTEFRVLAYIIALTAVISYIDIVTPQGFAIWILYMIPLFLTLYVRWPHAPFTATGIFIVLMAISFYLSPSDISVFFALADRIFFSFALIVASFFIWNYNRNVGTLRKHEIRYRQLAESSPNTLIVVREGKIVYINPAGLRLFGADHCNDIINNDFYLLVEPEKREAMREHIEGAMQGERTQFFETHLVKLDSTPIPAEALYEKIQWNDQPAVEIILRDKGR